MRAIVFDHYGPPDVLRVDDVALPVPRDDELLVRVRAMTVNRLDCHTREANKRSGWFASFLSRLVFGLRRPRKRILGTEFAGVVAEAGKDVEGFASGDEVFGNTGFRFGAHAEFVTVRANGLVARKPEQLTFEEAAAATDGAFNALWCLRLANPEPGQAILIYGASGAIGTAAVQLARHIGLEVTAVVATQNLQLAKSLGASQVIDYTRDDFTKNGTAYDIVFDAVGKHSFERSKGSIKPGGYYLACDGFRNLVLTLWTSRFGDKKVKFVIPPRYTNEDCELLSRLAAAGEYRPVVDRTYPMQDVTEACRYVETEQKVGNVVLQVAAD